MLSISKSLTSIGVIGFPPSDLTLTLKVKVSSKDLCWLNAVNLYFKCPDNRSTWSKVDPDLNLIAEDEVEDKRSVPLDESKSIPLLGGEIRLYSISVSIEGWGYVWYIRYVSVITVSLTLIKLMAFCLWACNMKIMWNYFEVMEVEMISMKSDEAKRIYEKSMQVRFCDHGFFDINQIDGVLPLGL